MASPTPATNGSKSITAARPSCRWTVWALDDIPDGGSAPYIFPAGTTLAPGAFLLRFRSLTGVALNNDADTVRLLGPDGAVIDSFVYIAPKPDRSFSRTIDGAGEWTDSYAASPGRPNIAPPPTPTATPSPTATPFPAGIALNEVLPEPRAIDWNGDGQVTQGDEWIEVYNPGSAAAALGGWVIADATGVYTLPVGPVILAAWVPAALHRTDPSGWMTIGRP